MLVVKAFSKPFVVPRKLMSIWENYMLRMTNLIILATHISREVSHCADKLANLDLLVSNFTWWSGIHTNLVLDFDSVIGVT